MHEHDGCIFTLTRNLMFMFAGNIFGSICSQEENSCRNLFGCTKSSRRVGFKQNRPPFFSDFNLLFFLIFVLPRTSSSSNPYKLSNNLSVSCKTWNLESWNLGILESWNLLDFSKILA